MSEGLFHDYAKWVHSVRPILESWEKAQQRTQHTLENPAVVISQLLIKHQVKKDAFVVDVMKLINEQGTPQEQHDFRPMVLIWEQYSSAILHYKSSHFRDETARLHPNYIQEWFSCYRLHEIFTQPTYLALAEVGGGVGQPAYALWREVVELLDRPQMMVAMINKQTQSVDHRPKMSSVRFLQALQFSQEFLKIREAAMTSVSECAPYVKHLDHMRTLLHTVKNKLSEARSNLETAPLDVLEIAPYSTKCQAQLKVLMQKTRELAKEAPTVNALKELLRSLLVQNQERLATESRVWDGEAAAVKLQTFSLLFTRKVTATYLIQWQASLKQLYKDALAILNPLKGFQQAPLVTNVKLANHINTYIEELQVEPTRLNNDTTLLSYPDKEGEWTFEELRLVLDGSAVTRDVFDYYGYLLELLLTDFPPELKQGLAKIRWASNKCEEPFPVTFLKSATKLKTIRQERTIHLQADVIPGLRHEWEDTLKDFYDHLVEVILVEFDTYQLKLEEFTAVVLHAPAWHDQTLLEACVPIEGLKIQRWLEQALLPSKRVLLPHQQTLRGNSIQRVRALMDCRTSLAPFGLVWNGVLSAHLLLEAHFV